MDGKNNEMNDQRDQNKMYDDGKIEGKNVRRHYIMFKLRNQRELRVEQGTTLSTWGQVLGGDKTAGGVN